MPSASRNPVTTSAKNLISPEPTSRLDPPCPGKSREYTVPMLVSGGSVKIQLVLSPANPWTRTKLRSPEPPLA